MRSPAPLAPAREELEPRDCWPTPRQELLLQAAFLAPESADRAWLSWSRKAGEGRPGSGEARLLPLVLNRRGGRGDGDRSLARFARLHRRIAIQNSRRLKTLERAVSRLEEAGIKTLILKGAALLLGYYQDPGTRPMSDLDLLVPTLRIDDAMARLKAEGWEALPGEEGRHHLQHASVLRLGPNQILDLHSHALYECRWPDADSDFWEAALPVRLGECASRVLSPADQLLHVMTHGLRWARMSPARWVADALVIIERRPDLDWSRLLAQAEARRLVPPVQAGLGYLHERLAAPIPDDVLRLARRLATSRLERLAFEAQTRAPRLRGPRLAPALHWDGWRRVAQSGVAPPGLPSLRAYLQDAWGATSLRQAAWLALLKAPRRLGEILRFHLRPLLGKIRRHA